jgi:hypothetical protein
VLTEVGVVELAAVESIDPENVHVAFGITFLSAVHYEL